MSRKIVKIAVWMVAFVAAIAYAKSSSSPRPSSSLSRPSASKLYNYSKPSSSGYSKPASHSSPNTSSGYSKPTPAAKASNAPSTSGGYSKPLSTQPTATHAVVQTSAVPDQKPQTAFAKGNRFDLAASEKLQKEQARTSRQALEESRTKFKSPPPVSAQSGDTAKTYSSNTVYSSTHIYGRPAYDDVVVRRRAVYGGWNPPVVVYRAAPYYGTWDSTFLWWALWHDSAFGYHHYNDPYYIMWRRDALRLAAEDQDLRAQLARQDAEIAALRAQGVATNSAYLPQAAGNDPLVALSDDAIGALPVQKPVLRVATGISGGKYHQIGQLLDAKVAGKFQIELVPTSGASENWTLLRSGKVDAAIVQSDTETIERRLSAEKAENAPKMLSATVYCEYVMLLVDKSSPIDSVKDLKKGYTIYVGPEGSGTAITWKGMAMQDERYKEATAVSLGYSEALERIRQDKRSAVMFVTGSGSPLLKAAAASGRYRLVPVDDPGFATVENDDGNQVYSSLLITADAYPGLQKGELKTLAVDAVWTLSDAWVKKYGDAAFDQVNYAVIGVISDLHIQSLKAPSFHPWKVLAWALLAGLVFCFCGLWLVITKINVTR